MPRFENLKLKKERQEKSQFIKEIADLKIENVKKDMINQQLTKELSEVKLKDANGLLLVQSMTKEMADLKLQVAELTTQQGTETAV